MEHKYSTWILFAFAFVVISTMVIADIDGMGTQNVLARFTSGGVIGNSSVTDNGTVVNVETSLSVQGSLVCTSTNGLCGGVSSSNVSNYTLSFSNIRNSTIQNSSLNGVTINGGSRYTGNGTFNGTHTGNGTGLTINMSKAMNTLAVTNGGTGSTTSTGTAASAVVLATSPTITTPQLNNPNVTYTTGNKTLIYSQNATGTNSTWSTSCAGNLTLVNGFASKQTSCARLNGFQVYLTRTQFAGSASGNYTVTKGNGSFNVSSDNVLDTSTFDWFVLWVS